MPGSEQARNACAVKGARERSEWELQSCDVDHKLKPRRGDGAVFIYRGRGYRMRTVVRNKCNHHVVVRNKFLILLVLWYNVPKG